MKAKIRKADSSIVRTPVKEITNNRKLPAENMASTESTEKNRPLSCSVIESFKVIYKTNVFSLYCYRDESHRQSY